jgi:phosphoribosylformylglycinamidine synthase
MLNKTLRNNRPITLMNLATIMTKNLKNQNLYQDVEESSEVNACGVFVDIKVNDVLEK